MELQISHDSNNNNNDIVEAEKILIENEFLCVCGFVCVCVLCGCLSISG